MALAVQTGCPRANRDPLSPTGTEPPWVSGLQGSTFPSPDTQRCFVVYMGPPSAGYTGGIKAIFPPGVLLSGSPLAGCILILNHSECAWVNFAFNLWCMSMVNVCGAANLIITVVQVNMTPALDN
jgi:hypothetical protein